MYDKTESRIGWPRYVLYKGMYVYFFLELIILAFILLIGHLCNVHWDKELNIELQHIIIKHIIMDYTPYIMEPEFFKTSLVAEYFRNIKKNRFAYK